MKGFCELGSFCRVLSVTSREMESRLKRSEKGMQVMEKKGTDKQCFPSPWKSFPVHLLDTCVSRRIKTTPVPSEKDVALKG